jgi:ArsR family transcriptional regulator
MSNRSRPASRQCCEQLEGLLTPELFKALGEPSRLRILVTLATGCGSWTVSRVASSLPINVSVVSRHLATLRDAGVLAAERRGKEVHYSVRYGALSQSLRQLADAIDACCPTPPGGTP